MKKIFAFVLACMFVFVSGCGSEVSAEVVEVKNGYFDLSADEFETNFNSLLGDEYTTANIGSAYVDEDSAFYSCDLQDGIRLSVLATPDSTMLSAVELSCDPFENSEASTSIGYYFAKLIYTVEPAATAEEIYSIADEIDIEKPLPGDHEIAVRGDIIYSLRIDDSCKMYFSAIASK